MKSTKTRALIVLVLLALGSSWLLPGVAGAGKKDPKKGLAQRVEVLEEQVADLMARLEVLEEGQGSNTNSFDVIHLEPLADFPEEPTDGDLCVVGENSDNGLYCYLNGEWRTVHDGTSGIIIDW